MLLRRSISVLNSCRTSLHSPRIISISASNLSLLSLSPAYFSSLSRYRQLKAHKLRAFATNAAPAAAENADTFLAEESVSWASLGVSDSISRALCNVGLPRPSLVQAACVPAILSGADVVVAAETGSGKTHGYLVPIIHKVCSNSDALHDPKLKKHQHVSLVLCPNVMLCEQVVRMANSLLDGAGEPLLKAAAICGRQGLSVKDPDIIVSTPVALLNYLYAIDPEKRKRTDFIRGVKYVVFDEADLLLCGSFQNQVIRLINMLRFDEKQLSRLKDADAGAQDPLSVSENASDTEEDFPEDFNLEEAEDSDEKCIDESNTEPRKRTWKDWMRVRKIYARSKQYIFVAATLPLNGKKTAGGTLKRMIPDANWVSGSYLHHHNPRLEQKWIEVTTDTQVDALINAVKTGYRTNKDSAAGAVWTMVFANTVEAAEAVANILVGAGIRCVRYHRDISLEERTENLVDFQQNGGVFVCTDAAARGLDVPNVSHVIQAEFASSAVDFLHRVGRTARAGQPGLVTSLFTESNRELVAAVRKAEELSLPVEKAFSRKRSFRNKIKKRGSIYLSPSQQPLPSSARKSYTEHVSSESMSTSLSSFLRSRRQHSKNLSAAPAPSPVSQGPIASRPATGRIMGRHRHHRRKVRGPAVSPSPSATLGCGQICTEPLTSAPFGSPCMCVFPMRVRLLLGVSLYAIFPEVTELEIEFAAGTYLKQSQVTIIGASADSQNQEKTVVDINLVPLGEKFDNTTAILTYQRILQKKVPLNMTLFGDYDVVYIAYPGLPSSPPTGIIFGEGPTGSIGDHQYPITADFVGKHQKMNPRIIIVISLSAFVLLVVCCAAVAVLLKCRKARRPSNAVGPAFTPSMNKRSGMGSMLSSSPTSSTSASLVSAMPASVLSVKTFSLVELEKATEKFSLKKVLGEGGFGRVYHGLLQDGTEVAVKLLTRGNQNGDREFIAEIEMLSRLHHRNLVKLIGICIEQRTRCLVYELIPNGSVESHLHGPDRSLGPLDWDARLKIALGAARGLAYLHEDSNPRVIHRDFKASNVLLEDDYTPKVSDFGLAREATEGSHHISTRVMGTFGYVAPEYAMTGHLLVKSDVYSYGVVLLELLSGRKPVDMSQPPGQENLVTWARPLLTNREGLEQLVDPSLAGSYDFDDMAKVAAIASMCVHPEVTHRPFMGEVVQALKLIYNDTDETCADAFSLKESSTRDSDFKADFAPSDSSWWNAGGITPRLICGQASFITMEYSSGPLDDLENRPFSASGLIEGGMSLPLRHGNRSGPLRTVRSNRAFYRLQGSMSEHGGVLNRSAWNNGSTGHEASF